MTSTASPATPPEASTPLMKQYWELKAQAPGALLLFRMGDFYELFGDDAVEAARILDLTLTSRDRNKANPLPMAGVPHHSAQGYIQKLLKSGRKVAIGEQMEDPSQLSGRAIVRREITRTFTPGVQFEAEGSEANYLAVIVPAGSSPSQDRWCLACLDASTGEALLSEPLASGVLATELSLLPIRHMLRSELLTYPEALQSAFEAIQGSGQSLVEPLPGNYLSPPQAGEMLKRHYGIDQLGAFIPHDAGILALGILVTYATRTQQQERLSHLQLPSPLHKPRTMLLGPRAAQHLDLLPSADGTPSLYQLINRTRSALGARQLKRWLLSPLKAPAEIAERSRAVQELATLDSPRRSALGAALAEIYDLERIVGRVNTRLASPRDTLQLGRSLARLEELALALDPLRAEALRGLRARIGEAAESLRPLARRIVDNQREDAPIISREGGIFRRGTSPDLDHLLDLTEDGQRYLVELETREREATGIPSLKVRYNRVFGYYIEITTAHLRSAPAHYQRKQTTVGAERFFTEELKKFEDEIVNASARQKTLELQLFEQLLQSILEATAPIMSAARALGELDGLLALALLADEPGWCFPEIDESMELEIRDGRHPLVDASAGRGGSRGSFVPNDLSLSEQTRLTLMITGPNMGGKSTVMRQCALIVILGQMGGPVPASRARWGAVSSLYTRIGAHDAIARGQSTFMVEMSELAHILHHADSRSLIILDEIGRGTSTYDGMSVAWATLEWICAHTRARTLFATHYHELTRLSSRLSRLANAHLAVEASRGGNGAKATSTLRFLYKLREGPANESFGIHVAQLAGLPRPVIDRAWKVLDELERTAAEHSRAASRDSTPQLSLFESTAPTEPAPDDPTQAPATLASTASLTEREAVAPARAAGDEAVAAILAELQSLELNGMTPLQAMMALARFQEMSRESAGASSAEPNPRPLQAALLKPSDSRRSAPRSSRGH